MKSNGLKIKVSVDASKVIELRDLLRECKKDAKELCLTRRQLHSMIKTISKENSSYRNFVKDHAR